MMLRETSLSLTASHLISTCICKTMAGLLAVKMLLPGYRPSLKPRDQNRLKTRNTSKGEDRREQLTVI